MTYLKTKVEIRLRKGNGVCWSRLHRDDARAMGLVTFGNSGRRGGTVGAKEMYLSQDHDLANMAIAK